MLQDWTNAKQMEVAGALLPAWLLGPGQPGYRWAATCIPAAGGRWDLLPLLCQEPPMLLQWHRAQRCTWIGAVGLCSHPFPRGQHSLGLVFSAPRLGWSRLQLRGCSLSPSPPCPAC